jgi:hypothetical protein
MNLLGLEPMGPRWKAMRPFRTHSAVLIVAGIVYIAIGFTYLTAEPNPTRVAALKYALNWLDYQHWGYVFMFVGGLAILSSRWPPVSETWGYMVLTGQSSAWALFYGAGVVFGGTNHANLTGLLLWGLIGFMWWAISRLANPEVIKKLLGRIYQLQEENLALHDELNRIKTGKE